MPTGKSGRPNPLPRYRVVGNHSVLGRPPGQEFHAELSPGDEAYYTKAGHLARLTTAEAEKEQTSDGDNG